MLDGDSLALAGEDIRLFGIDAPESRQVCRDGAGRPYRCGRAAARALAAATAGRTVACTRLERDRYHRQVALCTADGRDLGDTMVRAGHAVDTAALQCGQLLLETIARLDELRHALGHTRRRDTQ